MIWGRFRVAGPTKEIRQDVDNQSSIVSHCESTIGLGLDKSVVACVLPFGAGIFSRQTSGCCIAILGSYLGSERF
jgi:hypothetical protein